MYPSDAKVSLVERLSRLHPDPDARVILAQSGSDAVTAALKTAVLATGRPGVLAFSGAYHGLGYAPLAACGLRASYREPFASQLNPNVVFAPYPATLEAQAETLAIARDALSTRAIGAVLVEPILGRGGVIVPSAELSRRARDARGIARRAPRRGRDLDGARASGLDAALARAGRRAGSRVPRQGSRRRAADVGGDRSRRRDAGVAARRRGRAYVDVRRCAARLRDRARDARRARARGDSRARRRARRTLEAGARRCARVCAGHFRERRGTHDRRRSRHHAREARAPCSARCSAAATSRPRAAEDARCSCSRRRSPFPKRCSARRAKRLRTRFAPPLESRRVPSWRGVKPSRRHCDDFKRTVLPGPAGLGAKRPISVASRLRLTRFALNCYDALGPSDSPDSDTTPERLFGAS